MSDQDHSRLSGDLWAEVARTRLLLIITHGPAGRKLDAHKGRVTIATGNARTAADLRRLAPELVAEIEAQR